MFQINNYMKSLAIVIAMIWGNMYLFGLIVPSLVSSTNSIDVTIGFGLATLAILAQVYGSFVFAKWCKTW